MRKLRTLILLLAGAALLAGNVPAQSTGEVTGTITDSTGAVVPSAEVKLVNSATNVTLSGTTNEEGTYRFGGLQPGSYALLVTRAGFAATRLNGVVVEVNRIARADTVLQVAGAEATVNVQAGAQLLDTETGTKGTTIPIKQMRDLPLASRNPLSLMLLAPGSVATAAPGGGINLTWTRGNQTFRFGGDLRRYIAGGQLTTGAVNGTFGFAAAQTSRGTATTGYSAASLLLGLPNTATFSQPPRLRAANARARSLFQLGAGDQAGGVTTAQFAALLATALAYWDVKDIDGVDRHVEQLRLSRNAALSRGDACRLIYQLLAGERRGVSLQGGERD